MSGTELLDYDAVLNGDVDVDERVRAHVERLDADPAFKAAAARVAAIAAGEAEPTSGLTLQDLTHAIGLHDDE